MNKMLLLQTDYLTVDAHREDYSCLTDPEWSEVVWSNWRSELQLSFTVQCNGKIKRVRITTRVVKDKDWCSWSTSVNWMSIENRYPIYTVFQTLSDLWYDIPLNEWVHPLIDKAMQTLFNS